MAVLLSLLVGVAIVVQNGTVAHLMRTGNLWLLLVVSNLVVAAVAMAIFLGQRARGSVAEEVANLSPIVLIPGLCGLMIVAGMPIAIARIGVFSTVMIVIACQILASVVWDWYGGQPPSLTRALGAALVFAGVLLVMRPST
ncbi:DMT family transporter [Nannocystaceae bacterium ST9]